LEVLCVHASWAPNDTISEITKTTSPHPHPTHNKNKHTKTQQEKVVLLSLMNLVFATPAHERTLPFAAIAEKGRIAVEQVRGGREERRKREIMRLSSVVGLVCLSVCLSHSPSGDVMETCARPPVHAFDCVRTALYHREFIPHIHNVHHDGARWSGC
jgi:hypothetical protein